MKVYERNKGLGEYVELDNCADKDVVRAFCSWTSDCSALSCERCPAQRLTNMVTYDEAKLFWENAELKVVE